MTLNNFGSTLGGALTVNGLVTATDGTIITPGTLGTSGRITSSALTLGPGLTTLNVSLGASGDSIETGALTTSGTATVNVTQLGGILANGTYPVLTYTGASPGLGGFSLAPVGHSTSTLIDTGSAIALSVTANDRVIWDGGLGATWDTFTQSWKRQSNNAATTYIESDDVIFADGALTTSVDLPSPVRPSNVSFTNTGATTYTVSGFGGITGSTNLTKAGTGTTILRTQNSYEGSTTVTGGTLELDHDATGNQVLTATAGVDVATNATLQLTRDDGPITFTRNITGGGALEMNPHAAAGGATAHSITLSGNNTGFTGSTRLLAPMTGTYRVLNPTPAQLGSGTIEIQSGAQVFTANGQTYTNPLNMAGVGFADASGNIGALRLDANSVWAGPIVVNGTARIGAHNTTATVSGNISGGDLSVNATNFNNSYTLIFTGTNSYGQTSIGGQNTQTAGTPSMRLNIGNGGSTGTLGSGNVIINGDSANGVLGFDRSNGYTLAPGQTISAAGTNLARTFVDIETPGTGFSDNGSTITLGTATVSGGNIRISQARPNAVANFSGNVTTGTFRIGTGQTGGRANFNTGAVVNANTLFVGELANMGGSVTQAAGTTVNVTEQLRVGHFGTETSTYTMDGGTLTLTGASPNLSPSTAGPGSANNTGDNNINALATTAIVGGGIYLGIDGTGIFNQNNGTVTTNWIVLDNRGDTGVAANMGGLDQYNMNGGTLNVRSDWGASRRSRRRVSRSRPPSRPRALSRPSPRPPWGS